VPRAFAIHLKCLIALFVLGSHFVSYAIWNSNEFGKVPLTDFATPRHSVDWLFRVSDQRGILMVDGVERWRRDSEIPTYVVDAGDNALIVFSRKILSNRVAAQVILLTDTNAVDVDIPAEMVNSQPRGISSKGPDVYLLDYKPREFKTYLYKAHYDGGAGLVFSPPVLLDASGSQFGVNPLPRIIFSDNQIYMTGGGCVAVISESLDTNTLRLTALPLGANFYDAAGVGDHLIGLALEGVAFADKGGCTNCAPGFMLWDLKTNTRIETGGDFTSPTWLRSEEGLAYLEFARPTVESVSAWVRREANGSLGSGTLYMGIGNADTYLGWTAMDIMFARLDLLSPQSMAAAIPHWGPLLEDFRNRLDLEVLLVDAVLDDAPAALAAPRQSLTGKEPIILQVMSSRILRGLQRYREEIPNPLPLRNFEKLSKMVEDLDGHIEEFIPAGSGILTNAPYLRWKYGVSINFDGVNLPFNMQNEWVDAMLSSERADRRQAAEQMIRYFLDREGILTRNENSQWSWRYWWGDAYNGWTAAQNISSNVPSYTGYKNAASVGYRSIDATVTLRANRYLNGNLLPTNAISYFKRQVEIGTVYPSAAAYLPELPKFRAPLLNAYSRGGSAEDFKHLVWTWGLTLQDPGQPAWPADTDGDGLIDREEALLGTDSNVSSTAAEFIRVSRDGDVFNLEWKGLRGAVFEWQSASLEGMSWQRVWLRIGTGESVQESIPFSDDSARLFRLKFLGVSVN
jgi:hypothetical protein